MRTTCRSKLIIALTSRDRRTESGFRLTLADTPRAIDAPVFEYLDLTQGERDEV